MKRHLYWWRNVLFLPLVIVFLSPLSTISQTNATVTGRVTDEKGAPLTGATIEVKGTAARTITKEDGSFTINTGTNSTLVISSVGYLPQEVKATGQPLNISLKSSAGSLDDVVVVGYGTRRRGDVTGAIASVSQEKLREVPTTNITQALQEEFPVLLPHRLLSGQEPAPASASGEPFAGSYQRAACSVGRCAHCLQH